MTKLKLYDSGVIVWVGKYPEHRKARDMGLRWVEIQPDRNGASVKKSGESKTYGKTK